MNDILFELHSFKVRPDTIYQVTSKLDSFAPDAFREHKTSKMLHPAIQDSYPGAIYDSALGAWDNGLYINSRALIEAIPSQDERLKFLEQVRAKVVKPLEDLKGEGYLSQKKDNNSFWDEFKINIFKDRYFNTNKPEEVLQLYLALLHKQVTPQILESHPAFKESQFCIIDREDAVDRKQEMEMGVMEATGLFYNLLTTKREDLLLILDYIKLGVQPKTDDKVLASIFNNWLKDKTDGYQNYSVFIKTHKYFLTEEGEKELFYHSKIKDLIRKGVIKQKKNEIWFEDEYLASDLKSASKTIISNKDIEERFVKHIE